MLAESGASFERKFVDITKAATFAPEYLRMNPRGVVPTLVDEGRVVCDARVIAQYINDKQDSNLCRPGELAYDTWVKALHDFPVMLFSYSVWVLGKNNEKSADILADKVTRAREYAERYPDLKEPYLRKAAFFEAFRAQVYSDEHLAAEAERYRGVLDELGALLADAEWIAGDYSFADCIALSILYRLVDLKRLDHWATDESHGLHSYYQRLRARPSFRAVFYDDPLMPARYRPKE